jgi:predicted ATPase
VLRRIDLEDWKSFGAAALELRPLTVLVGTNASGKSNALEALQLLAWLASGQRLSELPHVMRSGQLRVRGTVDDLVRRRTTGGTELGCTIDAAGDEPELVFRVRLAIDADHLPRIRAESLHAGSTDGVPLYEVEEPARPGSTDVSVAYNNFMRGGKKPHIPATDQQAIFTQLGTPARFLEKHVEAQQKIPGAIQRLRTALETVLFLDPVPSRMRDWSPKTEGRRMRGDGSNLSSVMWELDAKHGMRDSLLSFVRSLPEQEIEDLGFLESPRGEVMVYAVESYPPGSDRFDASVLSDGTLRVLAIAATLLSAPPGATVVIEEIDNGVHPNRASSLLDRILALAEQRSLSTLISTHNPALLDAIPNRSLGDVVTCYRAPDTGESRLVALRHLNRFPELLAKGPLGRLVTQGIVERVVKDARSEEELAAAKKAFGRSLFEDEKEAP